MNKKEVSLKSIEEGIDELETMPIEELKAVTEKAKEENHPMMYGYFNAALQRRLKT